MFGGERRETSRFRSCRRTQKGARSSSLVEALLNNKYFEFQKRRKRKERRQLRFEEIFFEEKGEGSRESWFGKRYQKIAT